MPLYKGNLQALDKQVPLNLILELDSFAGGENILGADHELKNNQSRVCDNWECLSLGGMIRVKGFNEVADAPTLVKPAVHTVGVGLSDLTPAGTYTGVVTAVFTIKISTAAAQDKFQWKKDAGAYSAEINCTVAPTALSDGVTVSFAAITGHTLNNEWTITAKVFTAKLDLLVHHVVTTSTRVYAVIEGDLLYKNGASLLLECPGDVNHLTSGTLCHGLSKGDKLWITNATDNLHVKELGVDFAAATGQPASARERIYYHKYRLIAEGGGKTVYGSRGGTGNWNVANTWTLANDAWSIDLPDYTHGAVPGFPSPDEVAVFTKHGVFALYNFPNVAFRPIPFGHGTQFANSIALGNEGVFLLSQYPELGVFLWTGTTWINLTILHDFVNDINLIYRIFGIYRDGKYYLFYTSSANGQNYPDTCMIYDTKFGSWRRRNINSAVADNFGYPALLTFDNNELYAGSSRKDKLYELETDDTSDETQNTEANYKTKAFSSADFALETGGAFPIRDVRLKLTKVTIEFYGTSGVISIAWDADRGKQHGSQTFDLTAKGDLLGVDFIMGTSYLVLVPPTKSVTKSFANNAIGRSFEFQILNRDTGEKPQIKRIKIHAMVMEEI